MKVNGRLGKAVNRALTPLGIEIRERQEDEKPWDHEFRKWIAKAQAAGKDPNDFGDASWWSDPLPEALEKHYLPHVKSTSVVLELGPGSGRLTRHLIGRCQEMVLVDYSRMVCDWLRSYLEGKGTYQIHHIHKPTLPMIGSESIDVVIALTVSLSILTSKTCRGSLRNSIAC